MTVAELGPGTDVLSIGTGSIATLAANRGAALYPLTDWEDFPQESMDRVISLGGIDGLDLDRSAGEIMRVLRPGGRFVVAAPDGPWADEEKLRLAFGPYGVDLTFDPVAGHLLTCGRRVRLG